MVNLPAPVINGEENENGQISDFRRLVTLTMTLDRVILHTVMHHSSTSTYIPNFIVIEETFCGRTDGRADVHLRPALLGRLGGVDLKIDCFAQSYVVYGLFLIMCGYKKIALK